MPPRRRRRRRAGEACPGRRQLLDQRREHLDELGRIHVGVDVGQQPVGHRRLEMVLRQEGAEAQRIGAVVVRHILQRHVRAAHHQQRLHVVDADAVDPVARPHRLCRHIGAARTQPRHAKHRRQRRRSKPRTSHRSPPRSGPLRHARGSAPCARQAIGPPTLRRPAPARTCEVENRPILRRASAASDVKPMVVPSKAKVNW